MAAPIPFSQEQSIYAPGQGDATILNPQVAKDVATHNYQIADQNAQNEQNQLNQDNQDKKFETASYQRNLAGLNDKFSTDQFGPELSKRVSDLRNEAAAQYAATGKDPFRDPEFSQKAYELQQDAYKARQYAEKLKPIQRLIEKNGRDFYTEDSIKKALRPYTDNQGNIKPIKDLDESDIPNLEEKINLQKEFGKIKPKVYTTQLKDGNYMTTKADAYDYRRAVAAGMNNERVVQGFKQSGVVLPLSYLVHSDPNLGAKAIDPNNDQEVAIVRDGLLSHPDLEKSYGIDPNDPNVKQKVDQFVRAQATPVYDYFKMAEGNLPEKSQKIKPDLAVDQFNFRKTQAAIQNGFRAQSNARQQGRYNDFVNRTSDQQDSYKRKDATIHDAINGDPDAMYDLSAGVIAKGGSVKQIDPNTYSFTIKDYQGSHTVDVNLNNPKEAYSLLNSIDNIGAGQKTTIHQLKAKIDAPIFYGLKQSQVQMLKKKPLDQQGTYIKKLYPKASPEDQLKIFKELQNQ